MADEIEQDIFVDEMEQEFSDLPTAPTVTHKEANRILERMAEQSEAIARIDEQEADQIERIRARAKELREAHTGRKEWLEGRYAATLEEFARAETDGKKERSVRLLSGTVGFRRNPSSVEITDADALLAWAKENTPNAVKVVESVGKTPIKAHIEETGEVVPGVEYTPPADRFYIKEG
jgi:phage host-nuclease inhibitor protein Gam